MTDLSEQKTPRLSDRQKDIIQKFAALGSLFVLIMVFSFIQMAYQKKWVHYN